MTKKQMRENYTIQYVDGFPVKVYPPQDAPKSTWIKDYAYHDAKTRIPEEAAESNLFTHFTRKNQA